MPLNVKVLRRLVENAGAGGQATVARQMGIGRSTMSQLLSDPARAERVQWRTVARMADRAGIAFAELWSGPRPAGAQDVARASAVPRGTTRAARERPQTVRAPPLDVRDLEGTLRLFEQMGLTLADLSRRAREELAQTNHGPT